MATPKVQFGLGRDFWRRRTGSVIRAGALVLAFGLAVGVIFARSQPSSGSLDDALRSTEMRMGDNATRGDFGDAPPPVDLASAISTMFPEERCTLAKNAEREIRAEFERLGYEAWSVARSPGLTGNSCVGAGIDTSAERVLLVPALSPDTRRALSDMAESLLSDCLTKDQAMSRLRETLSELGETGWEVRTGAAIAGPDDQIDQIRRHVDAGCWIYIATGWSEDGTRFYLLGGR